MAQCEKCRKKIGVLGGSYALSEGRALCNDCASPISSKIANLYAVTSKDFFDSKKTEILEICQNSFSETVKKDITEKIDSIYKNVCGVFEQKNAFDSLVEDSLLTTGYEICGYRITKHIGIVSGEIVLGTGFLSELNASLADIAGGEADRFSAKLEEAKNSALSIMITNSVKKGGNAILGVDFDYFTLHHNMLAVVANGTSVIVEKIQE